MEADKTKKLTPEEQKIQDDKYARALLALEEVNYKLAQKDIPKQRHFISKKMLIWIGLSLVLSIITGLAFSAVSKEAPSPINDQTTQELLDTSQELKSLND